jgi:hypothetical protein
MHNKKYIYKIWSNDYFILKTGGGACFSFVFLFVCMISGSEEAKSQRMEFLFMVYKKN